MHFIYYDKLGLLESVVKPPTVKLLTVKTRPFRTFLLGNRYSSENRATCPLSLTTKVFLIFLFRIGSSGCLGKELLKKRSRYSCRAIICLYLIPYVTTAIIKPTDRTFCHVQGCSYGGRQWTAATTTRPCRPPLSPETPPADHHFANGQKSLANGQTWLATTLITTIEVIECIKMSFCCRKHPRWSKLRPPLKNF